MGPPQLNKLLTNFPAPWLTRLSRVSTMNCCIRCLPIRKLALKYPSKNLGTVFQYQYTTPKWHLLWKYLTNESSIDPWPFLPSFLLKTSTSSAAINPWSSILGKVLWTSLGPICLWSYEMWKPRWILELSGNNNLYATGPILDTTWKGPKKIGS